MTRRNRRSSKPHSWSAALDRYATHLKAKRMGERTQHAYLRALRQLRDRHAETPPAQLTTAELRGYQCDLFSGAASRSGEPLSASSVARMSAAWRGFFRFLEAEGHLPHGDPALRLELPQVPKPAPGVALTVEQVQTLLRLAGERTAPYGLRDQALLEVLYSTGLRKSELLALDLQDVDHERRSVHVRHGKGDKGRRNPLTRTAYQIVQDYLELSRPQLDRGRTPALFLNRRGGRAGPKTLEKLLHELGARAGVQGLVVTPHCLRRTVASHLLDSGASLRHIQLLLGHESLNTTAHYLRVDGASLREELLKKHPRERFEA